MKVLFDLNSRHTMNVDFQSNMNDIPTADENGNPYIATLNHNFWNSR